MSGEWMQFLPLFYAVSSNLKTCDTSMFGQPGEGSITPREAVYNVRNRAYTVAVSCWEFH
jgi:hypothetical protein